MIKEKNIFIIGIKGAAMANLAVILKKMGKSVTGSDTDEEFITSGLLSGQGISYINSFEADRLPKDTELVIYSAAHKGINNPQAQAAQDRKISVKHQIEIISMILGYHKNSIAVCGCHGKTTTSSLLAYTLLKLNMKPSYLVGSSGFADYPGGDFLGDDYFVVEADEYGTNPPFDKTPKLLFLKPKNIICTNIDFDHPDVYEDVDETKKTFNRFFAQAISENSKTRIYVCADDQNSQDAIKNIDRLHYFTYGFSQDADFQITDFKTEADGLSFDLADSSNNKCRFKTGLYGEKNAANVAAVIAQLIGLGFTPKEIKTAIAGFTGAKRRFEKIAFMNNIYLFDDYGHHPKEIETTIKAARMRFPKKRIIVIFQPHTYSRTKALLGYFAKSLSLADISLLLPIFPSARENPKMFDVKSRDITALAEKNKILDFESPAQMLEKLSQLIRSGDIIFTMGAGDVYKLKDDIIKIISKLKS